MTQALRTGIREVPTAATSTAAPWWVVLAAVSAKTLLLLSVVLVLVDPGWGNLEGKAPVTRALVYPSWALLVPVLWLVRLRPRPFPWAADLLLTSMAFSDILGNRLDLYDSVAWFDDWMHFMNAALLGAAVLLLAPRPGEGRLDLVGRAVAWSLTASLVWELWEYYAFVTRSVEAAWAYGDTLGDLTTGWLGAVVAALAIGSWRKGP